MPRIYKPGSFLRIPLADGSWWRELEEQFSQPIVQFMQDIGNFSDCTIFDTVGNERSAEPQECIGLERSAGESIEGVAAGICGPEGADQEDRGHHVHEFVSRCGY
ncbi:hypothetical protein [Cystobacter fuscus]|uniref:hypothetical protein n=1 Tax=Cystobacter fuscus TaxID=43 RepID=UPI0018DFED22|nr:hypothetical protein [Cystobacter fuscus]